MGNNAFEVPGQQSVEPHEMDILIFFTEVHHFLNVFHHQDLILTAVRQSQSLFDEITGEQELLLFEQVIVAGFIPLLAPVFFLAEHLAALGDNLAITCLLVFPLESFP